MSFRPADDGLTNALFSPSNLFLDGRDVDLMLREFAVDVLKLGAVAFVLRPPECQKAIAGNKHTEWRRILVRLQGAAAGA
jgi:hypothetical protein